MVYLAEEFDKDFEDLIKWVDKNDRTKSKKHLKELLSLIEQANKLSNDVESYVCELAGEDW